MRREIGTHQNAMPSSEPKGFTFRPCAMRERLSSLGATLVCSAEHDNHEVNRSVIVVENMNRTRCTLVKISSTVRKSAVGTVCAIKQATSNAAIRNGRVARGEEQRRKEGKSAGEVSSAKVWIGPYAVWSGISEGKQRRASAPRPPSRGAF